MVLHKLVLMLTLL